MQVNFQEDWHTLGWNLEGSVGAQEESSHKGYIIEIELSQRHFLIQ